VEHLLGRIKAKNVAGDSNATECDTITVEPELVVRNSTAKVNPARNGGTAARSGVLQQS